MAQYPSNHNKVLTMALSHGYSCYTELLFIGPVCAHTLKSALDTLICIWSIWPELPPIRSTYMMMME